jgi:hypothetical protein
MAKLLTTPNFLRCQWDKSELKGCSLGPYGGLSLRRPRQVGRMMWSVSRASPANVLHILYHCFCIVLPR